tara:strand:+ start:18 stop:620 length:603 start_codon:yes stop_codon:yes gene_type:complete
MSDKLKQLEIKKLLSEYEYLIVDDEYKQQIISDYSSQFINDIDEQTGKKKEKKDEGEPEVIPPEEKEIIKKINDEDLTDETKKRMKSMFRAIMKKTHPDKVQSEELVDMYIKSKEAYETNDILTLCFFANKLDVIVELSDMEVELLKDMVKQKKEELDSIEKSWLWLWYKANTEQAKTNIIQLYYNNVLKNKEDTEEETK